MLGNEIVLSPRPMGRYIEGVAGAADMIPGICLTMTTAALDAGNRSTWVPWTLSTGNTSLIGVLDFNMLFGHRATDPTQYGIGKRIRIYMAQPGDEFNMLLAALAGTTGNPAIAKGDLLGPQVNTGRLVKLATGTAGGTNESFVAAEPLAVALGNEWVHCIKS